MTTNSKKMTISTNSIITKKDFWSCYRRSLVCDASWNYERMQNLAFAYMMAPIIRRVYKKDEDKAAALQRHMEFMSVTPHISTLLVGIAGAMEEENSKNPDFDATSISAVKSSLMGPLAGIGDSFFWGTLKIIAAGIGISLAQQGNIFGPIMFLLVINVPAFIIRYICLDKGFKYGTKFFNDISASGIVSKVTTGLSMLGLMVIGGMTASMVYFELPTVIGTGEFAQPLMDYVNQIMPCMFPAMLFGLMYWLIGKKVKTTTILFVLIISSVILAAFKIV